MPALDDDREEALAQELAKGAAQGTAYITAGYPAKNNNVASVNCNRLLKKSPAISARAEELRQLARTEAANATFIVDRDSLTKLLMEDRIQAKQLGQVSAAVSAIKEVRALHGIGSENLSVTVRKHEDALADLDS